MAGFRGLRCWTVGVQGVKGCRVLGFWVWGFRVLRSWVLGFRVFGFGVYGLGFEMQVQGLGLFF